MILFKKHKKNIYMQILPEYWTAQI